MSEEQPHRPDEYFSSPLGDFARFGRHIVLSPTDSQEDLRQLREALWNAVPELEQQQEDLRQELLATLHQADPFELLMQFAIPYLQIDPNTWREWESDRLPAHVEYLAIQALSLDPQSFPPRHLDPRDLHTYIQRAAEIVQKLFQIHIDKLQRTTLLDPHSDLSPTERELRARSLKSSTLVRYSAYENHLIEILRGIFNHFSADLDTLVGFSIEDALSIAKAVQRLTVGTVNERLDYAHHYSRDLLKRVKKQRRKTQSSGDPEVDALAKLSPTEAKARASALATAWSLYGAREHTAISPEQLSADAGVDADRVASFLNLFTAQVEDLQMQHHAMPAPTHPLQSRPLLADGDAILAPVPQDLVFALLPRLEEEIHKDNAAWEAYQDARGEYVEDETRRVFTESLSGAQAWSRLTWSSSERQGELDVLISYDSATLRVQCKGGRITPSARRGGILRLRSDLDKLVGEGVRQNSDLRESLADSGANEIGLHEQASAFEAALQFDVVVTLEDLQPYTADAYKLWDFGTLAPSTPMPWIVSIADLLVIADLLPGTQLIHYLCRRDKLNRWGRVLAQDELDWAGNYLLDGLYFDESLSDPEGPQLIQLLSHTEAIDNWYFYEVGERTVRTHKPAYRPPGRAGELLSRLEEERPLQFVLAACVIWDWSRESHAEFSSMMEEGLRRADAEGAASVSLGFQEYGFSWGLVQGGDPADVQSLAEYLAGLDRGADFPLWVAVSEGVFGVIRVAACFNASTPQLAAKSALRVPS